MVEKLAIMQRQYVDWGNDSVEIEQELEFVKAYLSLQKYRFGDRLNYNLEIDPECAQIRIPKLTIVTLWRTPVYMESKVRHHRDGFS